jgi:predicted DsbA family dithiol-disulfide isomerase
MSTNRQIHIDIWSDYACPFCYLQQPVVNAILEEYRGTIILKWRAFELRPAPVPLSDPEDEYLYALWNRAVYPMAHAREMKLRFPAIQPRTRRAFQAAEFARAHGRFAEMHGALFRALFQEGLDLGSIPVLLQVGTATGLSGEDLGLALETGVYAQKVLDDEQTARDIGIIGVPTMVLSRAEAVLEAGTVLAGAQPYESVQDALERLLDRKLEKPRYAASEQLIHS